MRKEMKGRGSEKRRENYVGETKKMKIRGPRLDDKTTRFKVSVRCCGVDHAPSRFKP